jgi:hypothetical protein
MLPRVAGQHKILTGGLLKRVLEIPNWITGPVIQNRSKMYGSLSSVQFRRISSMKITTIAALSLVAFLGACTSTQSSAPGAVGAKKADCCAAGTKTGECCATKNAAAAPGAVGEKKSGCCSETAKTTAAPGAVSGKSECSAKTECTAKCPMTGK